jgi:hypothetical protein
VFRQVCDNGTTPCSNPESACRNADNYTTRPTSDDDDDDDDDDDGSGGSEHTEPLQRVREREKQM